MFYSASADVVVAVAVAVAGALGGDWGSLMGLPCDRRLSSLGLASPNGFAPPLFFTYTSATGGVGADEAAAPRRASCRRGRAGSSILSSSK